MFWLFSKPYMQIIIMQQYKGKQIIIICKNCNALPHCDVMKMCLRREVSDDKIVTILNCLDLHFQEQGQATATLQQKKMFKKNLWRYSMCHHVTVSWGKRLNAFLGATL